MKIKSAVERHFDQLLPLVMVDMLWRSEELNRSLFEFGFVAHDSDSATWNNMWAEEVRKGHRTEDGTRRFCYQTKTREVACRAGWFWYVLKLDEQTYRLVSRS